MNSLFRCLVLAGSSFAVLVFCANVSAQPAERAGRYDRLADDATATALSLTDEQKASIASIVSERDAALASTDSDDAKASLAADAQTKLGAVLTEKQQTQFTALFETPRIKFNFRAQKWAEVLPWLAGEAGLSLVMGEAPEGTFNYSDRREYQPDEAIDLLNGWLMLKGFTLIRRDQLLMCISLKDGIPDGTVPRIPLEDLPKRGRFEFVSVLIPLEARDAAMVMAEIEPLVSAWGEAQPLAATRQLLVTDAADIVRSIQQVALAVPPKTAPKPPAQAPAPKPELKTYPVSHANPAAVVDLLKKFMSGTILLDETASQITINAVPAQHALAVTLMKQLEENQGPDRRPELRTYPVRTDSPDQMLGSLQLAVSSATVRYDSASRRLVAFATPQDHQRLTAAMLELEQQATVGEDQLSVHALKDIDPEVALQTITTVLPEVRVTIDHRTSTLIAVGRRSELRAVKTLVDQLQPEAANIVTPVLQPYSIPPELTEMASTVISSVVPDATVTPDAANERLLIVAKPEDHETIAATLAKLAEDVATDGLTLRSYDARGINYSSVASLLQALVPDAQLTDESAKQRLLAIASAEDHERISNVLDQVRDDPEATRPQLRFYPLPDNFDQQQFTSVISSLALKASITVDDQNNRLMVTASSSDQQRIIELLEQLTPELPAETPQLKTYSLPEQVDTETFTSLLSTLARKATVQVDTANNRLLITATTDEHAAAQHLLEQLTSDLPDSKTQLKFYPLPDQFDQQQFTSLISSLALKASITVDDQNNRLMVTASSSDHQRIIELLEQVTPEIPAETPQLRSYTLPEQVDAETFTSLLSTLAKKATVQVDTANNRLLITATTDEHVAAQQLLEQLTSDLPDLKTQLKSYPLPKEISSNTVTSMLLALAPEATVTIDAANERVFITATSRLQTTVAAALEQLTTGLSPKRLELRTFPLPENVTASTVTQLLNPIAPDATVTVDATGHRILVTASEEDLALIAPMLVQLAGGQDGSQRQLKSYPLKADVDPATVTGLLNSLTPNAAVTTDTVGHRLLVTATARDHASIDAAIAQITRDARGELPELQYYPLERVDGEYAVGILKAIVSGSTIQFEPAAKRLSVIASLADHETIQQTLVKLEAAAPEKEKRALKVYSVTKSQRARFNTVLQGLTEEIPGLQVLTGGEPGEMIIWAKPSHHEIVDTVLDQLDRDIPADQKPSLVVYPISKVEAESVAEVLREIFPDATINVDSRASRVLVRARPAMQRTIKSAIQQLDAEIPAGQEIKLMVYPVKGLNAETALSLITQEIPGVTIIRDETAQTFIIRGQLEQHQAVAELLDTLRSLQAGILKFYPVDKATAPSVRNVLAEAVPDVSLLLSSDGTQLFARVTPAQHTRIEATLAQIAKEKPFESNRILKMYSFAKSGANTSTVLQRMVPSAVVNVGAQPGQLMIEATASDHALIEQLINQLEAAASDSDRELKFYDVDPATLANTRTTLVSSVPDVALTASTDNTRLIAHVTDEQHDKIVQVLEQLATEQPFQSNRILKVYSSAKSGSNTSSVLQRMVPSAIVNAGSEPQQLMIEAIASDHERIEQLITQLENAGSDSTRQLKFYDVDPATLANTRTTLVSSVPDVALTASTDNTRLIAHVTGEQHDKIVQVLEQLATEQPFQSNRILKVYSSAKSGSNTSSVLQRMVPSAIVNAGSEPQQLMIEAIASDHERIEQLITQLENAGSDSTRQLKFYDVDPATLANTRTTLVSSVPDVAFTASTDNTRLIAHVTDEQHDKIVQVLEQLATEQPFQSNRILKVYSSAKSGSNTSSVLQRMVPSAIVNAGSEPQQLMIEAIASDHERIEQLITQLENAGSDSTRQLKFYDVDPATLQNTRTTLASVIPQVTFTASTDGTRLIAHVTSEQHDMIRQTLEQLVAEQPFKSNRILKFYSVAKAGSGASSVLARLVPSAIVSTGAQSGQLMVEATPAEHEDITNLLAQMVAAADDDSVKIRFYAVDEGNLDNTRSVVTTVVREVSFTASADGTRLIAVVSDDQHAKIIAALQTLAQEQPFRTNRELMFYSMAGAGRDAVNVLQRLVPTALINNGSQADQLMVEATEAEHSELAQLLASLKEAAQDDSRTLRFYKVKRDQLRNAQDIVGTAVPGLDVETSADGAQLIALVTDQQHEKITATLAQLAAAAEGAPRKTTIVFDITGADPRAILNVLEPFESADRDVRITVDEVSNRVYVHAFADRQADIHETMLQIMSGLDNGAGTQVVAYFVGTGNGDEAQEALSALFPDATIVTDSDRRLIIATATPKQHEHIKSVAEQLAGSVTLGKVAAPVAYSTKHLDPSYVQDILDALFPRDRDYLVSVNSDTGQIVAVGTEQQHETIRKVLSEIDHEPEIATRTIKVYKTTPMSPDTVVAALEPLISRHTTISTEGNEEGIVVSAPAEEHMKIADLLQQMGISPDEVPKSLALYRVAPIDTRTVISALKPLVSKHVTLSPERSGQEIVVSAPPEEQAKIADLVQQMRFHRTKVEGMQIRSYLVGRGRARGAISVLSPMFPDATLVTDHTLGTLIATALPEEHETIAEVVRQMSGRGDESNQPIAKSYLMRQYDGNAMMEMLQSTFTRTDDVRITWDDRNKRIVAVARPDQHEVIAAITNELDPKDGPYARHLKYYPLRNRDLGTVNHVINGAIRHLDPGASVAVDHNSETLLVTTHDRGHQLVKDAIARFRPGEPKRLRIFQLSFMSPWEAHGAIDRMITGRILDLNLKPDVHPDDNLQQLWIRATDSQLKEIEELLIQLGEVGVAGGAGAANANLRIVPVGKDVEGALRRIEDLWPRTRSNPIRILDSGRTPAREPNPKSVPGQFSVPPEAVDDGLFPRDAPDEDPGFGVPGPGPDVLAADPNGVLGASIIVGSEDDDSSAAATGESQQFDGTDPVILIPGNGQITIASDDTDALNQLESLLRTIYSQGTGGTMHRDFSVRQLRNTAAADVSATIQQILEQAQGITYFGDVAVVPEERLNALILYGSRTDRRRLEPLLEILDSEKIDGARAYQTKLLPLKYSSATRMLTILQGIYKVQMTAGGRRSSMGIPSGVPSEVATVLRQINAAASAPLLIIETQRETNALIIKAPPDLLNEVAELAMELDEAALTKRANGVILLPLKKSNSKRVMEILSKVLK